MTKKIIFGLMSAIMLFAASCTNDVEQLSNEGKTTTVSFKVSTPEIASRAYGEGSKVNHLEYAVYIVNEKNGTEETTLLTELGGTTEVKDGKASVELELVTGLTYKTIFWATANVDVDGDGTVEKEEQPYSFDPDTRTVTVNYTDATSNDENRDAFYKCEEFVVDGATKTVYLYRPFAQLNIGTNDFALAEKAGMKVARSKVKVSNLYSQLNLELGTVVGEASTQTFDYANIPTTDDEHTFPVTDYDYLAMNYLLVGEAQEGEDKELVDVTFHYAEADAVNINIPERTVVSVPVKRNHRTNIFGKLLTSTTDINVEITPDFDDPAELVYVWDGVEVAEPAIVNEDGRDIYVIKYASELAWLAAAVNGTLTEDYNRSAVEPNDFAGKTFRLTKDVNLGDNEWTPIGSEKNIFKGTFDGQNHTISNLVITGKNSNVGLFGVTHDGEIKNFTVENAKVSGRLNVGVVAGQPYTSKYTNITVKGHVEVNGMAYVGGVGGKNAYADWTNIKVEADNESYVKAHSIENGTAYRTYVGGVVGFNGEGGHTFKNITSNINVEGSTQDVGGLFGIAHYGNQFENCVCTGNVEIYAAEEAAEAQEIGGIAGVWNNGGENVVFTNCEYTGTLTTNIEDVNYYYYGGLVGKPYSETGTGKLIIDGKQYVATAAQLQAALDAATDETTIYLGYDIEGIVTAVQKPGVKITIEGEGKKYNGSIKIHSNSEHYADAALTIKNVNFETSIASLNFIEALENGAERYSSNITVENCKFTATGEAVNTSVGVQIKSSKNAKVIDCTANNMHSLLQATSCDESVLVQNCTINNGKNGVAFTQVKAATVEGSTIKATYFGIRFNGNTDNYGIVVKNNNVTANQPLIVRKMTGKDNTIALEGTNTLTTEAKYQIVITNGSDDEEYVKPTGTYTLTGADSYTQFPAPFEVATWDEFTKALAAGEDWIKLTDNISTSESYTLTNDLKLELNGNTFVIDNATAVLNIGDKNNTTKPNVTIKGGNFNGMVYGLSGNVTIKNVVFGGTVSYIKAYQGVVSTKYANLLMENCKMTNVKKSGSTKPRSLCTEGRSSGYLILRDCNFKNSNLDRPYINPLNGNTTLELTNCALYGGASNIDLGASYSWTNMNLTGCSGGFTFTISRASTSLTDEEMAVYKAIKQKNTGTKRFIFSDGEKNNL